MKLSHFQILKVVSDTGSFSAAAAILGCTQSNVSHAIATIEKYVGRKLLVRSRSGCQPADGSIEIILKGHQLLEILDGMRQPSDDVSGLVRLGCFRSVGANLLTQVLSAVFLEHPNIQFDVFDDTEEEDGIRERLLHNLLDIAISCDIDDKRFVSKPFMVDPYMLLLPPSFEGDVDCYSQLRGLHYIQHASTCSRSVMQQLKSHGFENNTFRSMANAHNVAALVDAGAGFSILPRLAIAPFQQRCRLLKLPTPVERHFYLISRPASLRSGAVNAVLKHVQNWRGDGN
ncbi:LysR family transcriptional regulator [Rugamonas sp. CCM 8940]|uniref:LysR family transcriptional regulator n=1 Tax=Rugamonas sp. CCM 8940 TaxID=2765359 RepID=UPI0018F6F791|nr:LysR family transcriptional regulator [Rugamonas sp. CCM 8940]MBJ7309597.1 LysR family transcriptional regulator [Rugamonas sp. CCM 8940]